MLIFVAAPYSAPEGVPHPEQWVQNNIEKAMDAGQAIIEKGHLPLIPHLLHYFDVHTDGLYDYEFYMRWSMDLLRRCDALLFLQTSPGALREGQLAKDLGLPIFFKVGDIPHAPYLYR